MLMHILIIYLGYQLLNSSICLPLKPRASSPQSLNILDISPYRVYLVSLQHYLYILSVALVLSINTEGGRYPLYCPLVSRLSSRSNEPAIRRPASKRQKYIILVDIKTITFTDIVVYCPFISWLLRALPFFAHFPFSFYF